MAVSSATCVEVIEASRLQSAEVLTPLINLARTAIAVFPYGQQHRYELEVYATFFMGSHRSVVESLAR